MEAEQVVVLPEGHRSLASGLARAVPGTLAVLGARGGVRVPPDGPDVTFGRNRHAVRVPIGEDDRRVSRLHGVLVPRGGGWSLHALGKVPIRLPGSRLLLPGEHPAELEAGYTPLFVRGSGGHDHVLEVHVEAGVTAERREGITLSGRERLVLTVLGQRYLRHEPRPRPLSPDETADRLRELRPRVAWTADDVERVVSRLRPSGDADGLLRNLLDTATLVPPDLSVLERSSTPRILLSEDDRRC